MKLSVKGKDPISLAGEWKYLSGLSLSGIPPVPISPESNPKYPTGLFNAMIHPLTSSLFKVLYGIKERVIWKAAMNMQTYSCH